MAQLRPFGRSGRFGPPGPWALRLLLLAALLLGIVTMHTLGHPTGGHGGHAGHEASAPHEVAARQLPEHHAATVPMTGTVAATIAEPAAADGMDPMTVCLAVLAGWTLVLLVATGPLLRRSGDAAADVRARLLRAVRAQPPPGGGRMLLNRLSVLRQ